MSKTHFAALFGVDYELDLLPYWLKHWTEKNFDDYMVYLHRETGDTDPEIVKLFEERGWRTCCVGGNHGDGRLRGEVLSKYALTLPENDFLITADADEFHLIDYKTLLPQYDIIRGFMSDYYTYELESCRMDPFEQYLFQEEFTGEYLKNFSPPFLRQSEWKHTKRTKILAARAGYKVAFAGSHVMYEVPFNAKVLDDQLVHHFAWRKSAAEKLAIKSYYTKENLLEVFDGDVPRRLEEIYDRMSAILNTTSL